MMRKTNSSLTKFVCATLLSVAFSAGLPLSTSGTVWADEPQSVQALQSQLGELKNQMAVLKAKIENSTGDSGANIDAYEDALSASSKIIDKLLTAALEAVEKDATDHASIRTAMGILLNEANQDNDGKVLRACDRLIAAGVNKAYFDYAARAQRISLKAREIFDEALIRQREHAANDLPHVQIKTNKGDITIELFENEAPQTVGNFVSLVESGFYANSLFHRVIEDFMAQVGGPKKDGVGKDDPGYTIYDECSRPDTRPHFTGVVSMAKTAAPDSGSSQFFITFARTSHLDGIHTVFGRVIAGHNVVKQIARTQIELNGESTAVPNSNPDFIVSASVIRKRAHDYRPRKVGQPEEKPEVRMPPALPQSGSVDEASDANQSASEPTGDATVGDQ